MPASPTSTKSGAIPRQLRLMFTYLTCGNLRTIRFSGAAHIWQAQTTWTGRPLCDDGGTAFGPVTCTARPLKPGVVMPQVARSHPQLGCDEATKLETKQGLVS